MGRDGGSKFCFVAYSYMILPEQYPFFKDCYYINSAFMRIHSIYHHVLSTAVWLCTKPRTRRLLATVQVGRILRTNSGFQHLQASLSPSFNLW